MKMNLKKSECAPFEFLALYEAKGLAKQFDGILGLSPHKDVSRKKEHILWSFKNHGLIGRAMVSFSISQMAMKDRPYALFGGYNSTQIVNGAAGLKTFKNYPNRLDTWSLLGQGMTYDGVSTTESDDSMYPAIIDTGSSELTVPAPVF